jgi:hypothetical protein
VSKEETMTEPTYGSPTDPGATPTPPPPYQQQPSAQQQQLSPADARNWAMGAHLSSFVAAWIALGVLGPLVVMLVVGDRSPFVRRHAVEALNWNISALIYLAVSIPLMFILVGFLTAGVVAVCYVVFTIMGAVAASRGEEYRYPLTIRLVS